MEIVLQITYNWMNSPAPDYTLNVYSPYNLTIKDADGKTNELYTDGQSPTEFPIEWNEPAFKYGVDEHGHEVEDPVKSNYIHYHDTSDHADSEDEGYLDPPHLHLGHTPVCLK